MSHHYLLRFHRFTREVYDKFQELPCLGLVTCYNGILMYCCSTMSQADVEAAVFQTGWGTKLRLKELKFFYLVIEVRFMDALVESIAPPPSRLRLKIRWTADAFVEGEPVLDHR